MAVSISMNIVQNSQSIENNSSNVTVEVYAHWTRGSYNAQTAPDGYPDARGTVSIDNVQYTFYSKFNTGHTTSGSERIFAKTLNVAHNNEGEKILSCWASYVTGVSSGTVSTSGSLALTAIPRKSVLRAADGILGTAQNLKVERKSTQLTHTITYSCGNESDTICAKTASESLSWTPPLELAAQYPNSTSVPVVLTITTYHADNEVGVSSVTITCAIPESVVPTVTVEVSDYSNHLSKYGAYVQGKSKLRIVANATGAQGSTVKSYKTEVDGKSYSKASVTTEVLTGTGNLIVTTTVTDSRGRTATASVTVPVLAYTAPSIGEFSVSRCDAGGNASKSGAYLAVRFKAAITALNGKNSAVYTVQYKNTGISYYTIQTLGEYGGKHAISNGVFVFPAETAYSYDVILTAKDDFTSIPQSGVGSSIKKTWSIFKEGLGFAFGKIAEKANTLDMGWNIELNQNDVLRNGAVAYAPAGYGLGEEAGALCTDANLATKPGFYCMSGSGALNTPGFVEAGNYGVLLVEKRRDFIQQTLKRCNQTAIRWGDTDGNWSDWVNISPSAFAPAGLNRSVKWINSGEELDSVLETAYRETPDSSLSFETIQVGVVGLPLTGGRWQIVINKTDSNYGVIYGCCYFNNGFVFRYRKGGTWSEWQRLDPTAYAPAKTLLWQNASPTSNFAQQTISWSEGGYSHLIVEFTEGAYCAKFRAGAGFSNMFTVQEADNSNPVSVRERRVWVGTTNIVFYGCYIKYVSSTQAYPADDFLIPYRIYGIKGAT